jgi:HlyD family secretion protein
MNSEKMLKFGGAMDLKQKAKKQKRRNLLVLIVVVLLAAGGATGYYFWKQQTTAVQAQSSSSDLKTTQVRQGDLVISALGSGTLVAGETADLNFPVSGTVATLNVKVGDEVEEGQVLAVLDDLESLQAKVNTAQLDLITAQNTLEDLKNNSGETLGQAQLDLADAQKAYEDAKSELKTTNMARCDDDTTDAYYNEYLLLSQQYETMKKNGWNDKQYITMVKPVIDDMNTNYAQYEYCAGFTEYEISSSQATLVKTEA